MDASGTSVVSSGTRGAAPKSLVEKMEQSDKADDSQIPIAQIGDNIWDDDKSDASSLTFRETQGEKSIDLTRISSFLNRMDTLLNGQASEERADVDTLDKRISSRFATAEEVEKKLNELIETFGAKKANESRDDMSKEQKELLEKSQADIAKLSALLSKEIGDADSKLPHPTGQLTATQSGIESLPSLLSQVIQKLEKPIIEESEEGENDSKGDSPNKALESLFAKRIALIDEVDSQPKPLHSDPEYAKYFKMLKLGLPRESVIKAIERDGKDVKVLDLDPHRPLAEQKQNADEHDVPDKNTALKALFFKRAAAMAQKEENAASAALEALFVKNSGPVQQEGSTPALRVDPEFQKYMKMLKIGMPRETVIKALERDGKDPNVVEMDPEKSYASQVKKIESDPPLKEEYAKFFKVCIELLSIYFFRASSSQQFVTPIVICQMLKVRFLICFTDIHIYSFISLLYFRSKFRWDYHRVQCGKHCKRKEKTPTSSIWTQRSHMPARLKLVVLKRMLVLHFRMIQNSANFLR